MVVGKIQERIKKMKEAIETEAKQRAVHIVERAEEEADLERVNIMKQEKQKIDNEFSNLHKGEKVKAKIQKSSIINQQRIRKMEVRYKLVEQLKTEVRKKLEQVVSDEGNYKILAGKLIVQGLLRMMEKNVSIEVPNKHKRLIQETLGECEKNFAKIMATETNKDMNVSLALSKYDLEEKNKFIIGGVFLRSNDGLIVCENSLDARVDLIFEQLLPEIRKSLFPQKQA